MCSSWILRTIVMAAVTATIPVEYVMGSSGNRDESRSSVVYVESTMFGNFFVFSGRTIVHSDPSIYLNKNFDQECRCRHLCLSDPKCMAVSSAQTRNMDFNCRFASEGPLTSALFKNAKGTYIYRHASLIGETWGFMKDKLYYFEVPPIRPFNASKEICERMPGFRLAIIRTTELMIPFIFPRGQGFFLDLHKEPNGALVWGDSSIFTVPATLPIRISEPPTGPFNRPVFIFWNGFIIDQAFGIPERAICQANPLGVDW